MAVYLVVAALFPLWSVWQRVKGHLAECGGERLFQLQFGLVQLFWSTPRAKSSDLETNKNRHTYIQCQSKHQVHAAQTFFIKMFITFSQFNMTILYSKRQRDLIEWSISFTFSGTWHALYSLTCSSRPCLVQPSKTLSSRPCKERSSVASKLVQRGMQLIWTEVKDKSRDGCQQCLVRHL